MSVTPTRAFACVPAPASKPRQFGANQLPPLPAEVRKIFARGRRPSRRSSCSQIPRRIPTRRLEACSPSRSAPQRSYGRASRARPRAPARRTSRVVVRAAGSDGNAEDEDDLPPPIKLTADQARIAALAFEVLYEKDPREDMEEMLKDKERPGLRAKLQQAIKGALASPFAPVRHNPHLFLLGSSSSANADAAR